MSYLSIPFNSAGSEFSAPESFPTFPTKDQHVHTTNNHTPGTHKVGITNRSTVQLRVPHLALPTGLWKSSKSRLLVLPHTPHIWLRYIDDTLVILEAKHSQQLLQHINSWDQHIQFTVEEPNREGALPFLHTLVSPGPNNTLVTIVYGKPTHTNQYLQWDSNHSTQQQIVSSIL